MVLLRLSKIPLEEAERRAGYVKFLEMVYLRGTDRILNKSRGFLEALDRKAEVFIPTLGFRR